MPAASAVEASGLFPCPDCGKEVSRRAIMCPHCGCPGAAIQEAVQKAEEIKRPKRLTSVATEVMKAQAAAVQEGDKRYLIMDSFLLAGGTSLNVTILGANEAIAYREPELASDAPLLRLDVTGSDKLNYLSLPAEGSAGKPSVFLNSQDQATTSERAIAALDESGALVAIRAEGRVTGIHGGMHWIPANPGELRDQIGLLARAKELSNKGRLPAEVLAALKSRKWLTPYFEARAAAMIQSPEKDPTKP